MVFPLLAYGLYKLTNRNDDTTKPQDKVEEPRVPAYQPNRRHQNSSVIPDGCSNINCEPRDVYIASRVVGGGFGGGALALVEKYGLGSVKAVGSLGVTVLLDDAPDPTHHWCVVVGDYLHQLQATSMNGGWNYYTNESFSMSGGWTRYKLGVTNFNDVAVMNAAAKAMSEMDEVYNVKINNCQHFTLRVLDKILRDGRKRVKMLDQTYGRVAMKPFELKEIEVKIYKIGEEPPTEEEPVEEPKLIEQHAVKAPKLDEPQLVLDADDVEVGDRSGDVSTIASEEDHLQMIEDALAIMINNTPTLKETVEGERVAV